MGDEALLRRRLRVLDIARAELDDLHARIGTEGRIRLEEHQESLAAIERSISGGGCEGVASPDSFSTYDNDAFADIADAQLSLAVQALACDASRVVSVQMAHTITPVSFTWLGISDGHHTLSHAGDEDTAGVEKFVACERWFAEQVANTITKTSTPNTANRPQPPPTSSATGGPLLRGGPPIGPPIGPPGGCAPIGPPGGGP